MQQRLGNELSQLCREALWTLTAVQHHMLSLKVIVAARGITALLLHHLMIRCQEGKCDGGKASRLGRIDSGDRRPRPR